ncbi:hypothetical protein [Patiriisocius sp. Uisw_017]|jgi:hypothetical protein|uniref:hypothetical protein n=1 Tax=Patiriisocius sp. Uisw_017 TaxID=3230968 RepID=UPI0039ECF146
MAFGASISSARNGGDGVRIFDDSLLAINNVLTEVAIIAYQNPTTSLVQLKN